MNLIIALNDSLISNSYNSEKRLDAAQAAIKYDDQVHPFHIAFQIQIFVLSSHIRE